MPLFLLPYRTFPAFHLEVCTDLSQTCSCADLGWIGVILYNLKENSRSVSQITYFGTLVVLWQHAVHRDRIAKKTVVLSGLHLGSWDDPPPKQVLIV